MIKEAYVSVEVAKLLKEKGFDTPVNYEYHYILKVPHFHRKKHNFNGIEYSNCSSEWYSAPTLQMAMNWLREKGIECVVIPIWNTLGKQYRSYVLSDLGDRYKDNYDSYSDNISYKEAVEAALKYCLEKLI